MVRFILHQCPPFPHSFAVLFGRKLPCAANTGSWKPWATHLKVECLRKSVGIFLEEVFVYSSLFIFRTTCWYWRCKLCYIPLLFYLFCFLNYFLFGHGKFSPFYFVSFAILYLSVWGFSFFPCLENVLPFRYHRIAQTHLAYALSQPWIRLYF